MLEIKNLFLVLRKNSQYQWFEAVYELVKQLIMKGVINDFVFKSGYI